VFPLSNLIETSSQPMDDCELGLRFAREFKTARRELAYTVSDGHEAGEDDRAIQVGLHLPMVKSMANA